MRSQSRCASLWPPSNGLSSLALNLDYSSGEHTARARSGPEWSGPEAGQPMIKRRPKCGGIGRPSGRLCNEALWPWRFSLWRWKCVCMVDFYHLLPTTLPLVHFASGNEPQKERHERRARGREIDLAAAAAELRNKRGCQMCCILGGQMAELQISNRKSQIQLNPIKVNESAAATCSPSG